MNRKLPTRADLQRTIAELKAMQFDQVIQGASIVVDGATEFNAEDLKNELSMMWNPQPAK